MTFAIIVGMFLGMWALLGVVLYGLVFQHVRELEAMPVKERWDEGL